MFGLIVITGVLIIFMIVLGKVINWYWRKIGFSGYGSFLNDLLEERDE